MKPPVPLRPTSSPDRPTTSTHPHPYSYVDTGGGLFFQLLGRVDHQRDRRRRCTAADVAHLPR
ncbi:MAG: hypothetical protein AAB037_02560, partial [Chloroflexota bacterium]